MQVTGIQHHAHEATATAFASKATSEQQQKKLTAEEEKQVQQLKKRDTEVKRHEQAHKAAAGPYATGGPHFDFETGPDGKQYAVGGEVNIDTSKVPGDPEATIRKAQTIRQAALAPQDPSTQDRRVAAEASRMEAEARRELAEKKRAESEESPFYNKTGQTAQPTAAPAFIDVII